MYRGIPVLNSNRKIVGLRRAYLPLGVALFFMATGILFSIPEAHDSENAPAALAITVAVLLVGFMASGASVALVVWFNRPKFLVPPNRRNEAGSFADWKASR